MRALAIAVLVLGLVGCTPAPTVEPLQLTVDELQGQTVDLPLDSVLYVDTGGVKIDSYTATIADPSVVTFFEGANTGDTGYYPSFTPVKEGSTAVTMTNEDAATPPLEFTIVVVPAQGR